VETLSENDDVSQIVGNLHTPRVVDDGRRMTERDQSARRIAGVDGKGDTAAYAVRRGVQQKSVGLRILAAFARLVPHERQRAFERIEDARIALDIGSLIVTNYPVPRQRREIVDALVVVRPQVVARRRIEKAVEAELANDRQHGRDE